MLLTLVEDPAIVLAGAGGLHHHDASTVRAGDVGDEGAAVEQSRAG